jgi:thioredoxin 1
MSNLQLNTQNFSQQVLESAEPVLVDFSAVWCGPCRLMGPIVNELADEYADRAKVGTVDIDSDDRLASAYGVVSVPTFLIFRDGQVVERHVGVRPKHFLAERVDRLLEAA